MPHTQRAVPHNMNIVKAVPVGSLLITALKAPAPKKVTAKLRISFPIAARTFFCFLLLCIFLFCFLLLCIFLFGFFFFLISYSFRKMEHDPCRAMPHGVYLRAVTPMGDARMVSFHQALRRE